MSDVDARYRAKLDARAAGAKSVVFHNTAEAAPVVAGLSPVDARFRAKLAARVAVPAPAPAVEQKPSKSADDAELERLLAEEAKAAPAVEQKAKR